MSMLEIQKQLKAPKGQWNDFAKYNYRSCEDIVEAVKPILASLGYHLILSDKMIQVGGRVYVEATASVMKGESVIGFATASAREPESKKGMDESQITGAASSYARKYALNGLFAIDDTKDADHADNSQQAEHNPAPTKQAPQADDKPWFNDADFEKHADSMVAKIQSGESSPEKIVAALRKKYAVSKKMVEKISLLTAPY